MKYEIQKVLQEKLNQEEYLQIVNYIFLIEQFVPDEKFELIYDSDDEIDSRRESEKDDGYYTIKLVS